MKGMSAHIPDKALIRERFARAVGTYKDNAEIQEYVAGLMADALAGLHPSCRTVLEIGCGTGLFTRKMLDVFRPERLVLNDLCPEMLPAVSDILQSGAVFLPGDAEKEVMPGEQDLIVSCSAIQWFADIPAFFRKASSLLKHGGYLAVSTFGEENLREFSLNEGLSLNYTSLVKLVSMLPEEMEVVFSCEEIVRKSFPGPMEVLKHLKKTGVTGIRREAWTKSRLDSFCRAYAYSFSDGGGVSLTYHPVCLITRKS